MKKILFITTCLFAVSISVKSQITTSTLTPTQYVQNVLLGAGVTASNISYTGVAKGVASFTAPASTGLGITKGVYLTCGSNGTVPGELGPNGPSSGHQSIDQQQPGDAYLDLVSGVTTNDAVVLEFDFIPLSDTIRFKYIFGSEEYNDYVNGTVNDAFAFVLNGVSTPLPPTNIALIPSTAIPISINTVNNGTATAGSASSGPCSNCAYYRDNVLGGINSVYDGLTTVLTAKHHVICGQTYHIKIAIADGGDHIYDSGVFLEAGSFSSPPPVAVISSNSNASFTDSVMVEDCNTNCVYFIRTQNIAQKDSFQLQVAGNAILGSDYVQSTNPSFNWPSNLVFNALQDTIKMCNLKALNDNIIENIDTLLFTITSYTNSSSPCLLGTSIKFRLYIKDYKTIEIGQKDSLICNGSNINLNANASFGLPVPAYTYTWLPSNTHNANHVISNLTQQTNYTITVNDLCNKPVSKVITVTPTTLPLISYEPFYKFCLDSIKQIPISVTNGKPSYTITWQIPAGGIIPFDTIGNTYYFKQQEIAIVGTYTVMAKDQCNKVDTALIEINIIDCSIKVPNVVTPNGDNVNEYFKIHGLDHFPGSSLEVFNRWGNKIYSNENYKNDWKPNVNAGTYFYVVNVSDGRKFNGFFQVFRD